MRYDEIAEQMALMDWFRATYPKMHFHLFHIPNGQNVGRIHGERLKRAGLVSGVFDLFLMLPNHGYHGLFIEMKSEKGRASQNQLDFQMVARDEGYKAEVCKGFEDAKKHIEDYINLYNEGSRSRPLCL